VAVTSPVSVRRNAEFSASARSGSLSSALTARSITSPPEDDVPELVGCTVLAVVLDRVAALERPIEVGESMNIPGSDATGSFSSWALAWMSAFALFPLERLADCFDAIRKTSVLNLISRFVCRKLRLLYDY